MMKKIVILSHNIYPYMHRPELKISGGAEQQLSTLAILLAEYGYDVSFFTGDFGQADVEKKDGFTFFKFERGGMGKFEKMIGFIRLLRKIKPDYLLERGTSVFTFPAVFSCRLLKIPFIFCGASDINFARNEIDPFFNGSKTKQRLYQWALRHVTHFVVQKKQQAGLLKKNFGITDNVSLIRNFPPEIGIDDVTTEKVFDAIWVANWIPYKQPELFIELARYNPFHNFLLVGSTSDREYASKIKNLVASVPNVSAIGYVPPSEVHQWIKKSRIVVNTTRIASGFEEGFSNVILMGWKYGLPTLTLLSDPDNLIVSDKMGFRSGAFEQLCADFNTLISDADLYSEMSRNAMDYVIRNHDRKKIFLQYLKIFGEKETASAALSSVLVQ